VMVKGATMAVASPRIIEDATGERVTHEELGGGEMHARHTGQVDLVADDEEHALALVRLPGLDSPQRHQAERLAELLGQPEVVGLGPGEARIEAIRAGSAAVAEAFLAPAVPHLTDAERVVVVGDRFLHKLPFRLLWEAVGAPPVELGRVPSASILARLREGGDGASSASVFAYASGSPDLPQATREVRDLAGTYEGVGVFDPEARRLTPDERDAQRFDSNHRRRPRTHRSHSKRVEG